MEPLEFQRDWESRNAAGFPRPAGDVALHDTDPGVRPMRAATRLTEAPFLNAAMAARSADEQISFSAMFS